MSYLKNMVKKFLLKKENMYNNVCFKGNTNINLKTKFEGNNVINKNSTIINSYIGFGTYIGENSFISSTRIGKYCAIAPNVKTVMGIHPTKEIVSVHPAFYSISKQAGFTYVNENLFKEHKYVDEENNISISIGNDVWIGENVLILEGVKIGDGAIIGAGSIVTKDIEDFSINVGAPAKKIKQRFENDEIEFLKKFKWWNREENWIKENAKDFIDIKILKERNEKK